ncbi:HNH endonuclease [Sorangium sp. So ce861]|uniref:HNH endonuclease n=1 Tax=Sorangium sp. So ce861 TaxID=3133323 RepID=UPI003F6166B0
MTCSACSSFRQRRYGACARPREAAERHTGAGPAARPWACEYCRLPQDASLLPHQVDHITGRQHRGSDDVDNLCLCCIRCNLKKGLNIASAPANRAAG